MFYTNERFIKAHQDASRPYYNHSYDRLVRDVLCAACGRTIGEQNKYTDFHGSFRFDNEKDKYTNCPYCGHKFKK